MKSPRFLLGMVLPLGLLCSSGAQADLSPFQLPNPLAPLLRLNSPSFYSSSDAQLDSFALADWALLNNKKITFKDIIGGAPSEIEDLKRFIENSDDFTNAGAVMPRGYLFYGPPGTGKTLLARALAGEVNAAFRAESGPSFVGRYLGDGPARVREVFEWARFELKYGGHKHAIIFIDEFDSIGARSSDDSAAGRELNSIVNEFLVQMDGFNSSENIIVIGATNRTQLIDEALKRPGRFEYHIEISLPDAAKREALLRHYASDKFNRRVASDVNFTVLAINSAGFNCADMASLVNRTAIYIARKKETVLTQKAFEVCLEQMKKTKNI